MKASEIRELSEKDIQEKIAEETMALSRLRFQFAVTKSAEDGAAIRPKRRLIARLKTLLNEKASA